MLRFGEEKPSLRQQSGQANDRREPCHRRVCRTGGDPGRRHTKAGEESGDAQRDSIAARQHEAELVGEKSPMRVANIEQSRPGHCHSRRLRALICVLVCVLIWVLI